jgi:hypothetical protein
MLHQHLSLHLQRLLPAGKRSIHQRAGRTTTTQPRTRLRGTLARDATGRDAVVARVGNVRTMRLSHLLRKG